MVRSVVSRTDTQGTTIVSFACLVAGSQAGEKRVTLAPNQGMFDRLYLSENYEGSKKIFRVRDPQRALAGSTIHQFALNWVHLGK